MSQKEWFEEWFDSPYYPLLYKHRTAAEAEAFVTKLMQHLAIPSTSVVADVACGQGRYAKQLSKYADKVIGFDLSAPRIAAAKEKYESDKIQFYEHDMRTPMHVNYFDYVFNFFTSFGYFNTYRDHKNAAQSLANALKPGGLLIVDYFNSHVTKANLVAAEQKESEGVVFDIKRYVADGKIVKSIQFIDRDGRTQQHYERISDVSIADFTALFESVGLTLTETFGDYEINTFDLTTSPRLIMIFKK